MSHNADFQNLSFQDLKSGLEEKKFSSVEYCRATLDFAHLSNSQLNSFISLSDERRILSEAALADERLKSGATSPILGMPIAIKDMILCQDQINTAGSQILKNFVSPYDATVIKKIKEAGGIIIGKTNLDEFAMGSSNENSSFGPVKNPWDLSRVPGGSSGGSAAAVASRQVHLSLGTDTGGSIRQPASFCGVSGIKPTYGRVSRYGAIAFASSLDQIGPICSDALACAALLELISGPCEFDSTSKATAVPNFYKDTLSTSENALKNIRIGVPKEYFASGLNAEVENGVKAALNFYKSLGATLVDIALPHTPYALSTYYLICTSEASSNLSRYDGVHYGHRSHDESIRSLDDLYSKSRSEAFGPEVKRRILLGTFALSSGYYDAYFEKAAKVRSLIKKDFEVAFAKCDVIAGPTSPTTAFKLGEKDADPLSMYLSDIYTLSANLAFLPGMSFNVGFDGQKLPISLQLMAPWWQEQQLLSMSHLYQKFHPDSIRQAKLGGST